MFSTGVPTVCQRCGKDPLVVSTMSMFNLQTICMDCKLKEKFHPDYSKACDAERAAVQAGCKNWPGIGLPEDLKVFECETCKDLHFLLITEDDGRVAIQRCDSCCDIYMTDDQVVQSVYKLAILALDTADKLAYVFNRNNPNSDFSDLFTACEAWAAREPLT